MSETTITINGGENQIFPAAIRVEQNFYGDRFAEQQLQQRNASGVQSLTDEEMALYTYLPHVQKVKEYSRIFSFCRDTSALGRMIYQMRKEEGITLETLTTVEFLSTIIPLATNLAGSREVSAVRQQVYKAMQPELRKSKKGPVTEDLPAVLPLEP